ncbi:MAG: DUF2314 domain-containing protein [Verrucomicrobia bacterium]|nr:DUF2314 domain-containing protein [Verrucomicrobiota bacterium]
MLKRQVRRSLAAISILFTGAALPAFADNPAAPGLRNNETNEPESFKIPNEHAGMREGVAQARKTVRKFIDALQHPAPGETDFEVKKPLVQNGEVEHIWLSDVKFIGGRFQGKIDNIPVKVKGLKLGEMVSVNPDEISDWVFVDNGKLVGGYTIRAHYNELGPEQKKRFDQSADFKME